MTAQCNTGRVFRPAPAIGGRRVEIVHSVGDGIVHQLVYHLLVYLLIPFAGTATAYGGQAHHAEPQQRHLVARCRIRPVSHPVGRDFSGCRRRCTAFPATHARCQTGHGNSGGSHCFQEVPARQNAFILISIAHILYLYGFTLHCASYVPPHRWH